MDMSPFEAHGPDPTLHDDVRQRLRAALAALDRGDVEGTRALALAAASALPGALDAIVIDADCAAFSVGARRADLARRGSLRRILAALVDTAAATPGRALARDAVLAAGWPGEKMRAESGAMRVHTAIARLRRLGLGPALVTRDDGYLLDPRAAVVRHG